VLDSGPGVLGFSFVVFFMFQFVHGIIGKLPPHSLVVRDHLYISSMLKPLITIHQNAIVCGLSILFQHKIPIFFLFTRHERKFILASPSQIQIIRTRKNAANFLSQHDENIVGCAATFYYPPSFLTFELQYTIQIRLAYAGGSTFTNQGT
jgi:hypothetical protein